MNSGACCELQFQGHGSELNRRGGQRLLPALRIFLFLNAPGFRFPPCLRFTLPAHLTGANSVRWKHDILMDRPDPFMVQAGWNLARYSLGVRAGTWDSLKSFTLREMMNAAPLARAAAAWRASSKSVMPQASA